MDTGRKPVSERMKLCPFRKKRVASAVDCWTEEFLECVQGECALWNENGCGFGSINMSMSPETINSTETEVSSKEETQSTTKEESKESKTTASKTSEDNLEKADIKVLEARETKKGSVRAWCQFEDGHKEGVFAKNGAGKTLLQSTGKEVSIKYRRMEENVAFAVFASEK
ncbi:MAG: hypothetical protein FH758_03810 [Firmicutes bacterium]|nr:hypothetical protein [Bacillota bacterium]